jgi:hypothetical protein
MRARTAVRNIGWYLVGAVAGTAIWIWLVPHASTLGLGSAGQAAEAGRAPSNPTATLILDRLAQKLNLSRVQQVQVKSILDDARQFARPMEEELREIRQARIRTFVEGPTQEEIERLNRQTALLYTRISALESVALGRIIALLDAGQKSRAQGAFDSVASYLQSRANAVEGTDRKRGTDSRAGGGNGRLI